MLMLLASGFASQFGLRMGQVILPLMALDRTGSVWATGLVGGAAGIPQLLAPWWARRARHWAVNGKRLGVLEVSAALAMLVLPLAPHWSPALLAAVGLATGALGTLAMPARAAMLADAGEAPALAWQDSGDRAAMITAPLCAAFLSGGTAGLLAVSAAYTLAGALSGASGAGRAAGAGAEVVAPRVRDSLKGRREVVVGWVIRGCGCFGWFAFSLGLPLLGPARAAAGFAAYGIAALCGGLIAVRAAASSRPAVVSAIGWAVGGAGFVVMGMWPDPIGVGLGAVIAGLGVPPGNAAITASLLRAHRDAMRRTALAGQQTVVTAASTAGMLLGAPVLGLAGVGPTLVAAGLFIAGVAIAAHRFAK